MVTFLHYLGGLLGARMGRRAEPAHENEESSST